MSAIANGGTFYIGGGGGASSGSSSLNYSTEEQVVGTWVDGKPIYQKTFKYDSSYVTNWGGNSILPFLIDSGNIVNYQLLLFMNDGVTVCESWTSQNEIYCININTDRIVLFITSNFQSYFDELYITVQYIKTTD